MGPIGQILALILLDLVLLAGWIAIPLGLSGNFILLAAALVTGFATGFHAVGWLALVIMTIGVLLGEVLEALLGSLMARRFGAGRWGMLGAFLGGIVGAVAGTFVLPVAGSIAGSFAGAAAGAVIAELIRQRKTAPGLRAGWGAFLGKMLATGVKMAIGTAIIVYVVIRTH